MNFFREGNVVKFLAISTHVIRIGFDRQERAMHIQGKSRREDILVAICSINRMSHVSDGIVMAVKKRFTEKF